MTVQYRAAGKLLNARIGISEAEVESRGRTCVILCIMERPKYFGARILTDCG